MGALSSASPLILRCILRRPPPSTTTNHVSAITPSLFKLLKHTPSISLPTPPLPISRTALSSLTLRSLSTSSSIQVAISTEQDTQCDVDSEVATSTEQDTQSHVDSEIGTDDNHQIVTEIESPVDAKLSNAHKEMLSKLKGMSVKEKKELGSYANSLGKKLKSQQVGKSGVTDSVATALVETLEANELLKLKIHNNCPGELEDVVNQLEEATGSVVVGRIGRTVIIYRPSLTKLKAEEKKKQALKVFLKRRAAFKSSYQGQKLSRGQSNRSRDFRKS
ncbi:uncharacterized protein LOC112523092 [Cynara cardunculus var. scolymus]|uniref:RNA-binding, CRM domain-containing protein n=1 Tax=Cynara cardunculus var. scolymus TaxID=59895 RepID=A0A103XTJ5_CYNCS|nr:uncharacterized protein LOC112523092 [Cynara cardunculus var. scolymus]KVH96633.1 RNA-binding, CRM domain-containing protein [Cynara cardunculus var. scolymus]